MTAFNILLDARKLGDGGIGAYLENLIEGHLFHNACSLTLIVKPRSTAWQRWRGKIDVIEDGAKPYSLQELLFLGRRFDWKRFDLFHSPHFTLPLGIPCPKVVTVHDLMHVYYPEKKWYPLIGAPLILSAGKRADRIITVSRASADDLCRFFQDAGRFGGEIKDRIRVIPNAFSPSFMSQESRHGRYGDYLLSIHSNNKPHKGLSELVEAFKRFNEGVGGRAKLIVAGQGVPKKEQEGIRFLGPVSEGILGELYRGARAVVVSSKAEGFCLPVLEAHSAGTPVVARPVPAVQELLTEFDIVVPDLSIEALTRGMLKMWGEAQGRARGLEVQRPHLLERFSRDRIAWETYHVYCEAILGSSPDLGYTSEAER